MKEEEEGKRERRKRRREGEVNRVWVDEDVKSFPFFLRFVLLIDHHLPTNKMPLFPIQQYPSSMKNSPDPVWYSTP